MADPLIPAAKPITPVDAIGHVAPNVQDTVHFNTLVIRPEYRISLRLGDFEELFDDGPTKDKGRAARLQVLGLFYFPLKHKKWKTAFKVTWQHYKKDILKVAKDNDADQDIQNRLQNWIVQDGQLPPPAADPKNPKPENFAKIRFPGGYTFFNAIDGDGIDLNKDTKYPFDFGSGIDEIEALYRRDNPILHKIPLVALVEKKDPESGEWKPAPKAAVYFQLVAPYDLPAFQDGTAANDQINRPPLRESSIGGSFVGDAAQQANAGLGPQKYAEAKDPGIPTGAEGIAAAPVIDDNPQAYNCPKDHGGKNGEGKLEDGTDVADVIFATGSTKGFNTKGSRTKHPLYPVAERATPSDDKHKHAVKAMTNEEGEAGVIFTPCSCGGDRYRIRAYVGPDTLKGPGSDGSGINAVSVDTGTFVIWRHLRISRYVRHDVGIPANELLDPVYAAHTATEQNEYLRSCNVVNSAVPPVNQGLAQMDCAAAVKPSASKVGQLNGEFDRVVSQFAKAFCEVEMPPDTPHVLTADEWKEARKQAVTDMKKGMKKLGLKLDLDRLFHMNTAAITWSNCVTHLPMRTPDEYNQSLPFYATSKKRMAANGGHAKNTPAWIGKLFGDYGAKGFLRTITHNGYLPGLTVIQGAFGCSWQMTYNTAGTDTLIAGYSGVATEYRGAFVWCGSAAYPRIILVPPNKEPGWTDAWQSYDYTSNCCHELGHCLSRVHAAGNNPGGTPGGGHDATKHDPLADSICVMAYKACEGQYCAKCLFAIRGWSLTNLADV